jgi:tRNA modification GTPase
MSTAPFTPSTEDTIVAISTPPGRGGIGVVRLSGSRAAAIATGLFRSSSAASDPGRAVYGAFLSGSGDAIDDGYLILFRPPRSFTGEEMAELWAHGSPPVLRALVEGAVAGGARPATPGEFTLRAFLNGRIDATQAEAIGELIASRTLFQARVAREQRLGRISAAVDELKDRLTSAVARVEAAIEFADEPEAGGFLPEGALLSSVRAVRQGMERLAGTHERGRRLRDGARVVLAGAPNVGKSSLFNRLLEEERAIVTPIAGTTRDLIEETLDLGGLPVALIDSAGLHETSDDAGAEAVRRARVALETSDVAILVLDWSRPLAEAERGLLAGLDPARVQVVLNKVDCPCGIGLDRVLQLRQRHGVLELSARTGEGIDDLRRRLSDRLAPAAGLEDLFLTSVRQHDLLRRGAAALTRVERGATDGLGGEYLVVDLRDALDSLGEITGEVGTEAIYDRIFSTFCIGK